MYLPTGFKIYAVDDAGRVDVFAVNMGTHQHFAVLKKTCQPPRGFVRRARVNVRTAWEALHHVVELNAAVLVVQELRTEKFVERRFRLAADAADELLSIPERLIFLCHISHHAFHAAARLRTLFVIHEMDDCDFVAPPSCNSRRAVLILANACTAEFRFAN